MVLHMGDIGLNFMPVKDIIGVVEVDIIVVVLNR